MWKAILAVILGYLTLFVWVTVTLLATVAIDLFVIDGSLVVKEGTSDVTIAYMAINLGSGFIGAILGGVVAAAIAASPTNRPVHVLAGLCLVFGLALAVWPLVADAPADGQPAAEATAASEGTESDDMMAAMKAMQGTTAPTWYNFTLPFMGVLLGGRLKGKRAAPIAGEAP